MPPEAGRRRIYRARAVRRRRSAIAVALVAALTIAVVLVAQTVGRETVRVRYDRRAAVAYADAWALDVNPAYWSSPDSDCANFVSQCLAAGGLRPTDDAGRAWRPNGTDFPTVAWVNCGAQKQALSRPGDGHSRYVVRSTRTLPRRWSAGDLVYLGDVENGRVEWQHVIVCAGKDHGRWVYDSHTAARRHVPLAHWYPAHFTEVRFCRVANVVTYDAAD